MKVYFFGWPGPIGGADTKLAHLLPLLRREFDLTVVPGHPGWHRDSSGRRQLAELNIPSVPLEQLPPRLSGWGVALCNGEFLSSGMACEARRRGLRLAWSNEMMCLFPAERGALTLGLFDAVLYVSAAQRRALEPEYRRVLNGEVELRPIQPASEEVEGWIEYSGRAPGLRWVMTGNYINPAEFPFLDRRLRNHSNGSLVVGRLSRPDPAKFPPDFPRFYESLGLHRPRFRVMGWTESLAARWSGHFFGPAWELLPPAAEKTCSFLQSLDLFIYSLHPTCRESWGRVVAEAMLTGAIPLVPAGPEHHLQSLLRHGESGFLCPQSKDFGSFARLLERDTALRQSMSERAHAWAVKELCDADRHLELWRRLFYGPPGP